MGKDTTGGKPGKRRAPVIDLAPSAVRVEAAADTAAKATESAAEAVVETVGETVSGATTAATEATAESAVDLVEAARAVRDELVDEARKAADGVTEATATETSPDAAPTDVAPAEAVASDPAPAAAASATEPGADAKPAEAAAEAPTAPEPEPAPREPDTREPEPREPDSREPGRARAEPVIAAFPPPRSGPGVGAHLGSALGGGAIAAAAAYGLALVGLWPGGASGDLSAARQTIAALEKKVEDLAREPRLSADQVKIVGQTADRFATLEKTVKDIPGQAASAVDRLVADLQARLGALTKERDAAAERINALQGEMKSLRDALARAPAAAGDATVTALQQAVADLRGKVGDGVQKVDPAVQQTLADLRQRLAAAETRASADLAAARERLAQIETEARAAAARAAEIAGSRAEAVAKEVQGLKSTLGDLSGRVGSMTGSLDQLKTVSDRAVEARGQATLAVALGALKAAVDAGRPFANELAAAKAVAAGAVDLAPLDAVAAKGVTPAAVLVEKSQAVARQVMVNHERATAGDGLMNRLVAGLSDVVRVRPVGEVAGDGVPERLARLEARLAAGDLAAAHAEWSALPEAARAGTGDFGPALAARVAADKALDTVMKSVLSSLSKPTQ